MPTSRVSKWRRSSFERSGSEVKRLAGGLLVAGWFAAGAALGAGDGLCPPTPFLQSAHYGLTQTSAVGVGDFNGDLKPDAVVLDEAGTELLLGDGLGGLGPPTTVAKIGGDTLTVADFNGDGKLDLAIARFGHVDVLLGNGDGTFTSSYSQNLTGGAVDFLLAVDVDGDHHTDLLLDDDQSLMVLIGNGDGTFKDPADYSANAPRHVAAADFDEDGKLDIAAVNGGGTLSILLGNGDGSFKAPIAIPIGQSLTSVAAGDIDGDGHADIAVSIDADSATGYVGVLRCDGQGHFLAPVETSVAFGPYALRLRDLDGDGRLDLVMLTGGGGFSVKNVEVCRGTGGASPGPCVEYLAGNTSLGLDLADLDDDGALDVLTADDYFIDPGVTVLMGNGGARLRSVVTVGHRDIQDALAGDFDGDGLLDVMTQNYDDLNIAFLKGNGDGSFGSEHPTGFAGPLEVAGHFDANASLDVVAGGVVLLNDGHGNFHPGQSLTDAYPTLTADFRGNGSTDLVGAGAVSSDLAVLLGNGDGTFGSPVVTPLSNIVMSALAVGRLDGDSRDDVAVGTSNGPFGINTVSVMLSSGDGTFTPRQDVVLGAGPLQLDLADVTGDGQTDLLAANGANGTYLAVGHGDGTFDDPVLFDGQLAFGVAAADFDQDGVIDVVTLNYSPTSAKFFRGLGGGAFAPAVQVDSASISRAYAVPLTGSAPSVMAFSDPGVSFLINARIAPTVVSRSFIVGDRATLSAAASGFGTLTYLWRRNGAPLSDGGPISGATTATLTIDPVAFTDAGSYDIVVTDSCTNATSNAAALSVEFDDVPLDNPFHNDILTIATAGITGGCTPTSYCPGNDVSRAEMAVFLLKSKYGADHVPPAPVQIFPDVPNDAFAAAWIDELATLQITTGCVGGLYCPDRPVSRAEMAVFLLKTLLGSGYAPPTPVGLFADVPLGSFAVDWIEDLYNRGITAGCANNPLRYCPDADVPREQMATFLVRTFLGP